MSPVVPRYGEKKVYAEPFSNPQRTVAADEETFGGGASNKAITSAVTNLNTTLQTKIAEEQKNADDVLFNSQRLKLAEAKNRILSESYKMTGENWGKSSEVAEKLQKEEYGKIIQEVPNDRVRARVNDEITNDKIEISSRLLNFQTREREALDTEKTTALTEMQVAGMINNYDNQRAVNIQMYDMVKTVKKYGFRNGLPKEVVENQIAELKSKAHIGIIGQMQLNGMEEKALEYLEKNSKEIRVNPNSYREDLEWLVFNKEADKKANDILAMAGDDTDVAIVEAEKIKNGKMQNRVKQMIEKKIRLKQVEINTFESARSERIAEGNYSQEEFVKEQTQYRPEMQKAMSSYFMVQNGQKERSKDKKLLRSTFLKIDSDLGRYLTRDNPDERREGLMRVRMDILANAQNLEAGQFSSLIGRTSEGYVQGFDSKASELLSAQSLIVDFFKSKSAGDWLKTKYSLADAVTEFNDRTKTADKSELMKISSDIVRKANIAMNPKYKQLHQLEEEGRPYIGKDGRSYTVVSDEYGTPRLYLSGKEPKIKKQKEQKK